MGTTSTDEEPSDNVRPDAGEPVADDGGKVQLKFFLNFISNVLYFHGFVSFKASIYKFSTRTLVDALSYFVIKTQFAELTNS